MLKYFGPSTRAPKFSTQMPWLFIIKICFTINVNTIFGVGQLSGSWISGSQVPNPRVSVLSSHIPGSRVASPKVPGPDSQALILDYAVLKGVIQVKLYFYEILPKNQTKEERLHFLKTIFSEN